MLLNKKYHQNQNQLMHITTTRISISFTIICLFFIQSLSAQAYKKIHEKAIVVDTHNDILMHVTDDETTHLRSEHFAIDADLRGQTHSDLSRFKEGGMDVQVFSIFCDGEQRDAYQFANRQIDSLDALIARNEDKIVKVYNIKELKKAVKQKKLAALVGVEGGHMIEDDLDKLNHLFERGTRYLTLTWNNSTSWATSAYDETYKKDLTRKGLTPFGEDIVKRMNTLGMLIDVSHLGEQSFWDVMKITSKPIIASHSSVYELCHHQRNLKDDQIKAIAKNGGVVQINFNPGFIDSTFDAKENMFHLRHKVEKDSLIASGMDSWFTMNYLYQKYADEINQIRPSLDQLIKHIDYIVKLVGADYVGIGSDFDGINVTPKGLDDVTGLPLITKSLIERGYNKRDIYKILGGNFLRVLKANE